MKQIFILIDKSEVDNITGFYDRREMTANQAAHLNSDLETTVWVLTPNY